MTTRKGKALDKVLLGQGRVPGRASSDIRVSYGMHLTTLGCFKRAKGRKRWSCCVDQQ